MGKQVVSREEFLARIRAAVIARDSIPGDSDFVRPLLYTFLSSYLRFDRSSLRARILLRFSAWRKLSLV